MDEEFAHMPCELEASDDEPDDYKHAKLLQTITNLDGRKKTIELQRTEPAGKASEFHLAPGSGKVDLKDLVGALQKTTSHGKVKKQLGRVQSKQNLLNTPLPKNELDKIQRGLAYETTTTEVSKWDPIVTKNRKAEQLEFPLVKPAAQLRTTKQMTKGYQPRTPLEIEVAKLLAGSSNVCSMKKELTQAEECALRAMSVEEAKERRAELQKYRVLLSYKEAKARRQKKIKSKKYHRILRKEKEKSEKKTLEELQCKDPEAYADLLLKLQKDRIQERMSLKHREGSKFMKRQQIYGKFDDKTRQSMADMLEKSKELRQKVDVESSSSAAEQDDGEDDDVPPARFTPSGQAVTATENPWITAVKPADKSYGRPETMVNVQKAKDEDEDEEGRDVMNDSQKEENGEECNSEQEEEVGRTTKIADLGIDDIFLDAQRKMRKTVELKQAREKEEKELLAEKIRTRRERKKQILKEKLRKKKKKKGESSSDSDESDSEDEAIMSRRARDMVGNEVLQVDPGECGLSHSLKRKQAMEDFDGEASDDEQQLHKSAEVAPSGKIVPSKSNTVEPQVDPKKYLTMATLLGSSTVPELIEGSGETAEDAEDQQRITIAQAFAMDDVVEEFKQDKLAVAEHDKPKDIDLTLPGWGEWGGTGVQVSRRKKRRFIIKAPKGMVRKDKNLDGVIISETKDNTISKHQVKRIPFPFTSVNQFEASVRAPVGKTWNPENAYRKLIQPKLVTKMGTVIDPMDKAQVFKKQGEQQLPSNQKDGDIGGKRNAKKGGNQQKRKIKKKAAQ